MIMLLVIIAVVVGGLMPIQASINAELGRIINHRYLGALISFLVGTLGLSLIVLLQGSPLQNFKKIPLSSPHLLSGGLMGALFVASSIFLIPKLGAVTLIAAFVTGQLLMSVVLDHYGLFGLTVNPMTLPRAVGIILLFAGLWLVIRKTA